MDVHEAKDNIKKMDSRRLNQTPDFDGWQLLLKKKNVFFIELISCSIFVSETVPLY